VTGQHDGLAVTHRRLCAASHAHYGGSLVDGAYVLGLFGDVATEAAIRMDGDEGLFASTPTCSSASRCWPGRDRGDRDRRAHRPAQPGAGLRGPRGVPRRPGRGPSASRVLGEPVVVVTATGTVVVP